VDEDLDTEEAGDEEMGQAADHDVGEAGAGDVDDQVKMHDHVKIGAHVAEIGTLSDTQETRATSNETRAQLGLVVGARVKIHSLERSPELNGVEGQVLSFNASTGRWSVKTQPDERSVSIAASHLTVMPAAGGGGGEEASSPGHMGHMRHMGQEQMLPILVEKEHATMVLVTTTFSSEEGGDEAAEQDAEAKARVSPDAKARRDSGATAAEPPPSPAAEPAVLRTLTGADVDQVA
jgi:hypothetical protein